MGAESRIYDKEGIKHLLEKDQYGITSDAQTNFDMLSGPNDQPLVYNDLLEKCRSAIAFDELNGSLYQKLADTIVDYKHTHARTEMRSHEYFPENLPKGKNVNFGR